MTEPKAQATLGNTPHGRAAVVGVAVAVLLLMGGAAFAARTPSWKVTDVGTPPRQPGAFMNAVAINDRNQVLGEAMVGPPGSPAACGCSI